MALAVPRWYTITQSFRGGVKGNDKFYYVRDFGDFFSIIDFSIIPKRIDGIIFQKITKITRVIVDIKGKKTLLDTTKTIFVALDKMVTSLENSFSVSLMWPVLFVQENM